MFMSRVVIGCFAVCLLAASSLQAQKATCTNWKTFVLNPADLNNPSEESDGVNDNHTVVGRAFYNFNKPNFKGFVHYSTGKITYWRPSNAKYSWLSDRKIVNGNTELTGSSDDSVIVVDHYGNAFLYSNGVFKDIVGPQGQQVTVRNISAGGIITGDTSVPGSVGPHGFTATCQ